MRARHKRAKVPTPIVLTPQRADGEPYTTSEIIAEGTGIDRRKVRDAVRRYKTDLEAFGKSKYSCFSASYIEDLEKVFTNPVMIYKDYKTGVNGKLYA